MSDTFTPDVGQHIDAAGRVTYEFGGKIIAQGIDLPSGLYTEAPDKARVQWRREDFDGQPTGAVIAEIRAWELDFSPRLTISVNDADRATLQLAGTSPTDDTADVRATALGQDVTIIDSNRRSHFLQLAALADRKINVGAATVTWLGGSTSEDEFVEHGLGRAPVAVFCTGTSDHEWAVFLAHSFGGATFAIRARTTTGAGSSATRTVYWLAIG